MAIGFDFFANGGETGLHATTEQHAEKSTRKYTKSEVIEDTTAPIVASFSSRGPNYIAADILKPDITAPGIDITAAYYPVSSPSGILGKKRSLKYNILSRTSMACLKTFHPDWSLSAIKSAPMTIVLGLK
ncbi:subtilisin-like protease SBT4.7 [Quercus lobata]|nr:subtilisin-like protease SBT4.7 [Quercus lobata]